MNNEISDDLNSTAKKIFDLLQNETNEEATRILDLAKTMVIARRFEDSEVQFARQLKQLMDAGIPHEYIDALSKKKERLFKKIDELSSREVLVFCPVIPHKLFPFKEQRRLLPYTMNSQIESALGKLPEHTQDFPDHLPYFCVGVANFQFVDSLTHFELRSKIRNCGQLPMVADEILATYAHTNVFVSHEKPPIMQVVATGYSKVGKVGVVPVFSINMVHVGVFPELQLSCFTLSSHFSSKLCFVPTCLARI